MSFIKKSLHYLIKVPRSALNKFLDNKSFGKSFLVFLLFMMLIFYYGSLSFFRPLDESWITTSIPKAPVQNPFGLQGAWVSSVAFYFCGVGAWIFPLPFLFLALALAKKNEPFNFFFKATLFLAHYDPKLTFFLSYYKNTIVIEQITLAAGGSIGSSISEWLILNWGPTDQQYYHLSHLLIA